MHAKNKCKKTFIFVRKKINFLISFCLQLMFFDVNDCNKCFSMFGNNLVTDKNYHL